MEYISNDTNVWIDFSIIGRLHLPFYLPYNYIMDSDALSDELLSPQNLCDDLVHCGLISVEITIEEFELAQLFGSRYPKLSTYDRIALSIAKQRRITLLTGDKALRRAAMTEGITIVGTIGILDQLFEGTYINEDEYRYCLNELCNHNGREVRLPEDELHLRLLRIRN